MADDQIPGRESGRDFRIERNDAEAMLRRVGYSEEYITEVLAGISFPTLSSTLQHRGTRVGISVESLMDRLGGSP